MIFRNRVLIFLLFGCVSLSFSQQKPRANKPQPAQPAVASGQVEEKLFSAMRWRQVGPFRGGRVLAGTGVPGAPSGFYFGGAGRGVTKTTDARRKRPAVLD